MQCNSDSDRNSKWNSKCNSKEHSRSELKCVEQNEEVEKMGWRKVIESSFQQICDVNNHAMPVEMWE